MTTQDDCAAFSLEEQNGNAQPYYITTTNEIVKTRDEILEVFGQDYSESTGMRHRKNAVAPSAAASARERFDEWYSTSTWKKINKNVNPMVLCSIVMILLVLFTLSDFTIMKDGEFYSQNSQCERPLVFLKDSGLSDIPTVAPIDPTNDELISEIERISKCYLEYYKHNLSCITPVAYGMSYRLVSFRQKNGQIRHIMNPQITKKSEETMQIPERNTLLPDHKSVNVTRSLWLSVSYRDAIAKNNKEEKLQGADAFCVLSSLDLFNHILPQHDAHEAQKAH